MKNLLTLILLALVLNGFSQMVDEETKRKFTFGLDVFTDMWQDIPSSLDPKTLNPGVNLFGSYNYMFGNSNVSFSPGIGLSVHNLYSESLLVTGADTTFFHMIGPDTSFKKTKLTTTYLDIPIEIRYKSKGEFRIAVGFKFGFLMKAQNKYKGDDFINGTTDQVIIKQAKMNFIEKNRYGFTGRIGYKWLNLWGYYQLSSLFTEGNGAQMYPISLGITLIPF